LSENDEAPARAANGFCDRGLPCRVSQPKPGLTRACRRQTIAEIHRLLRKGEAHLSPEEDRLLDLLSTLAKNWEEAHHIARDVIDMDRLVYYRTYRRRPQRWMIKVVVEGER